MNKRQAKKLDQEYRRRVAELREIRSKLGRAYSAFDNVTDPNIMDACIFEISALRSRYNYAVMSIKNMNSEEIENGKS